MGQALDQSIPVLKKAEMSAQLEPFEAVFLFGAIDFSLVSWVEENPGRCLVFIQEDEQVFLKDKTGGFSEHSQVRIFCYGKEHSELFKQIAWEFVFLQWGYFVLEEPSQEIAQECFSTLEYYHRRVDLLASEYRDMGVQVLSNVLANLPLLQRSVQGSSLEGACTGMTAIICGAGESLTSLKPLFSQLQNRALIIAGGSAVRALNAQGITPHLIAGIDPNPSHQRFLQQESFETPFFYQSRFCHALLQRFHGPLVWMPSQSLIPLESHVTCECGLFSEPFDAGWTVANFCTALAVHLGVKRIIFAGVDFISSKEGNEQSLIELQQGVYTQKDWLMSAEWMRSFIKNSPSIEWMNASSPVVDLLGVPLFSLETMEIGEEGDISARVHGLITEASPVPLSSDQIQQIRSQVKKSFEMGSQLLEQLLSLWQKEYPQSPLETPTYVLILHDFEQEICYVTCLAPLWEVWKHSILRTEFHPLARNLHQLLFFKNMIETHLSYLRSY